jgi:O-acetyl-ADP-ribose deacetylase (regulator of RNase III)
MKRVVKGDLVELAKAGEFDVIIHGCNCFHTMGAGIARQLAEAFPGPHGPAYVDMHETGFGDENKLGSFSTAKGTTNDGGSFYILNAYTQYTTASGSNTSPVDYSAIRDVFRAIATKVVTPASGLRVGYPAIGAGLAGGNWDRISAIIDEEFRNIDHTYVLYDPMCTTIERKRDVARRLRDAARADIFYDPWAGAEEDEEIDAVISTMYEAADLLEKS